MPVSSVCWTQSSGGILLLLVVMWKTLTVDSRGKVNGFGGVNYYNGQLRDTFTNGSFQFDGAVAATMRYGRGINQERDFFQKLNQIDSWQVNADGVLELRAKGKVILKFARQQDPNSR